MGANKWQNEEERSITIHFLAVRLLLSNKKMMHPTI